MANLVGSGSVPDAERCSHGAAHRPREACARAGAHGVPRAPLRLVGPRERARKHAVGRACKQHSLVACTAAAAWGIRDECDDGGCARVRAERGEGGGGAADVVEARGAVAAAAAEHVAEARGPAARGDGRADAERARSQQRARLGHGERAGRAAREHEALAHVDCADRGCVHARRARLLAAVERDLVQPPAQAPNKQRPVVLVARHTRATVLLVVVIIM